MTKSAFADLYHASYPKLSAQISSYLGDAAEAEDVLQEAYLRTWQRWEKIGHYDDPFAYLRRIAWNLATSRWRRVAVAARHLRRQGPPAAVGETRPDHVAVVAALKQLPERQRQAIVLHHIADMPVDDITGELGAPRGTVLSWLHRGRERLAVLLDESEPVLAVANARPVPAVGDIPARATRRKRRRVAALVIALLGGTAAAMAFLPLAVVVPPPVDTITNVDWTRTKLDLPAQAGSCPTGTKQIQPEGIGYGTVAGPRDGKTETMHVDASRVVFGDLTGDGQPEAIVPIWCSVGGTDMPIQSRPDARLLVVQMRADYSLQGLGYVGPGGAYYISYGAVDGQLIAQVQYETETTWSVDAPAHRRTYRWDGNGFVQTSGRTTPLVLVPAKSGSGSLVKLAGIRSGDAVVCPARTIRFDNEMPDMPVKASSWTDLDGDGDQEGIVQLSCAGKDSLYLLGQGAEAFETRDIPFANDGGYEIEPDGWSITGKVLTVKLRDSATGLLQTRVLTWNGRHFTAGG